MSRSRAPVNPKATRWQREFATRLRALREKAGFTIDQAAERAGRKRATWEQYERGIKFPLSADLDRIAWAVQAFTVDRLIPPQFFPDPPDKPADAAAKPTAAADPPAAPKRPRAPTAAPAAAKTPTKKPAKKRAGPS